MGEWKETLVMNAYKFDFPIYKPYYELSDEQRKLVENFFIKDINISLTALKLEIDVIDNNNGI